MVLPLNMSRRELVRATPGMRSMILPMEIMPASSPRRSFTASPASRPPRQAHSREDKKALASVLRMARSRNLSITPMTPDAAASSQLPPKNRAKEEETRA